MPAAIHITPECVGGGPLAEVRDGDVIRLDCNAGVLEAKVDAACGLRGRLRSANLAPNDAGTGRELFRMFRANAVGAEQGGGLEPSVKKPLAWRLRRRSSRPAIEGFSNQFSVEIADNSSAASTWLTSSRITSFPRTFPIPRMNSESNPRPKRRRRIDILSRNIQHLIHRIDNEPNRLPLPTQNELNDDDAGALGNRRRRPPKPSQHVDDRHNRPAQIDHPSQIRGHHRHFSRARVFEDLANIQNAHGEHLATEHERQVLLNRFRRSSGHPDNTAWATACSRECCGSVMVCAAGNQSNFVN